MILNGNSSSSFCFSFLCTVCWPMVMIFFTSASSICREDLRDSVFLLREGGGSRIQRFTCWLGTDGCVVGGHNVQNLELGTWHKNLELITPSQILSNSCIYLSLSAFLVRIGIPVSWLPHALGMFSVPTLLNFCFFEERTHAS